MTAAARIAAYSALILFFELALIRYTAGYVRVFAFYLNFVLIATFLGMGVGLLRADDARRLRWLALPAAVLLFGAVSWFAAATITVPADPDEFVWGIFVDPARLTTRVPLSLVAVSLFTLCALFFVPLGALLGEQFRKLPPLRAYAFDILGSLTGILAFALLSLLRQPPLVWFAIGFAVWLLVSLSDRRYAAALGLTGAAVLGFAFTIRHDPSEQWSPYYRIGVKPEGPALRVDVNGSLHQYIIDVDSTASARHPYTATAHYGYTLPYRWTGKADTALVVGAGTGNDVALLLAQGASHVDAVEIDPVIAGLGRELHPRQPYSDPRVRMHIQDARAFLRRTDQKYDHIVFGTLDSQTLLSGMSSVQLDNYVYTVESFRAAHERLKPGGSIVVYHMSPLPYIGGKIFQMVSEAAGTPPGAFYGNLNLFNLILVSGDGALNVPAPHPRLVEQLTTPYPASRDDWPYLYLRDHTIPGHYRVALLSVLLVTGVFMALGARRAIGRGVDAAMFFMGAGFLLVETKSVTEMSLLFGSTWTVNILVFASILVMVLLANLYVLKRPPLPLQGLFAALFASLALAYLVPASALLFLGTLGQWLVGGLMVALPILCAALIFSTLFRQSADPTRSLAWNLLGAIVGGVLEYASMALGIKALYLLAAAIYLFALLFATRRREVSPAVSAG